MLSLPSTATPQARSPPLLPKLLAHSSAPEGENFATKISLLPAEFNGPPPKSIVFGKIPTTTMLLDLSTATPLSTSSVDGAPKLLAHTAAPEAEYFATNTS